MNVAFQIHPADIVAMWPAAADPGFIAVIRRLQRLIAPPFRHAVSQPAHSVTTWLQVGALNCSFCAEGNKDERNPVPDSFPVKGASPAAGKCL